MQLVLPGKEKIWHFLFLGDFIFVRNPFDFIWFHSSTLTPFEHKAWSWMKKKACVNFWCSHFLWPIFGDFFQFSTLNLKCRLDETIFLEDSHHYKKVFLPGWLGLLRPLCVEQDIRLLDPPTLGNPSIWFLSPYFTLLRNPQVVSGRSVMQSLTANCSKGH